MTKILNSGACRGILLSGMAALPSLVQAAEPGKKPMNVLFIVVDDLKPMLGCYGNTQIKTPNIDRLARWGTVFTNAYCQQAVSAPTRVSLLTGFRPDNTRVHDLNTPLPTVRPDLLTLPGLFRKNGYTTISLGKVFHHGKADAPDAWSVDPWMPPAGQWVNPANMRGTNDLTEEAAGSRPW
ncbi:MAG: sulfatase-like hydrolase/transferase, partial [Bacteroidales bacterium]